MATQHHMRMNARPFGKIKAGLKTIELRLNDEKRQRIMPGDTLVLTSRDTGETLLVEVVARLHYRNFHELVFAGYDPVSMGYDDEFAEAFAHGDHGMDEHYSAEEQAQYGALGLVLKVVQA